MLEGGDSDKVINKPPANPTSDQHAAEELESFSEYESFEEEVEEEEESEKGQL